jgi:hypothetical protein
VQTQGLRDGVHEQRLADARHADHDGMAPADDRDQQPVDHLLLADDDLPDLGLDARNLGAEFLNVVLRYGYFIVHRQGPLFVVRDIHTVTDTPLHLRSES